MSAADRFILELRKERDAALADIDNEVHECEARADELREKYTRVLNDFDSRIGDLSDALNRGLSPAHLLAPGDRINLAGVITTVQSVRASTFHGKVNVHTYTEKGGPLSFHLDRGEHVLVID